jgi:hypothetical protein
VLYVTIKVIDIVISNKYTEFENPVWRKHPAVKILSREEVSN